MNETKKQAGRNRERREGEKLLRGGTSGPGVSKISKLMVATGKRTSQQRLVEDFVMYIEAQISERLFELLVFADELCLVLRLVLRCLVRRLAFELLERVEDEANVAFQIADYVGHLLGVAEYLDRLIVRVVSDGERTLDLQRKLPKNEARSVLDSNASRDFV